MRENERLSKGTRFAAVYSTGKTWANKFVVLKALPNELEVNRYAFVTGKRLGKAVVRNKVRRLLREGARLTPCKLGWDLIFIARNAAVPANFHRLREAEEELLKRAGLFGNRVGLTGG